MNFAAALDQLRRQEYARLAAMITPTAPFREQIALMMERLGHTIITDPTMISNCGPAQMLKRGRVLVVTSSPVCVPDAPASSVPQQR